MRRNFLQNCDMKVAKNAKSCQAFFKGFENIDKYDSRDRVEKKPVTALKKTHFVMSTMSVM